MTRSELIAAIAGRFPQLGQADSSAAVTLILDAITERLVARERVEIRGFGVFETRRRAPTLRRNPRSGEVAVTPAVIRPYFRAGKKLKQRVLAG